MSHSTPGDCGSIRQASALVAKSGTVAARVADVLIEHAVPQVTDAAIWLRCKGPVISVAPVVTKKHSAASPPGRASGHSLEHRS